MFQKNELIKFKKFKFKKAYSFGFDNNGTAILMNSEHIRTIQYIRETEGTDESTEGVFKSFTISKGTPCM